VSESLFFPVFYIVKRDERDRLAVRFADWPIGRALVRGLAGFAAGFAVAGHACRSGIDVHRDA
jgi:hypothetical protein